MLSGIIEIDETYVGGKRKGVYAGKKAKTAVIGMRERGGDLKLRKVPCATSEVVKDLMTEHVSKDARVIMTDDSVIYPFAMKGTGLKHRTVTHSKGEYARYTKSGTIHTNTVESAFSLLKRGIIGTYHQLSPKHMQRYLHEFEWRFNRRKEQSTMHDMVMRNLAKKKELPYKELTAGVPAW
jgi:transposase-like protein